MAHYLLAIDQGTSSNRAHLFNRAGELLSSSQQKLKESYPQKGWVEQDPEEIWRTTLECCREVLKKAKLSVAEVSALGLTNQRETTLLWDKKTGQTIYPAINWQDRRTADLCEKLAAHPIHPHLREKTGLLLDPYFSATKILWLLEKVPGARQRAEKGELLFGTIDSFLLWRLTKGRVHATDATNASRTLLFNIRSQTWDTDILAAFQIPASLLPQVLDSSADFGQVDAEFLGRELPIAALIGDQQGALVGQACFEPGSVKTTFGTGCFMVLNTGTQLVQSKQGLLTTLAYRLKGKATYALEGSLFSAGSSLDWLKNKLKLFESNDDIEILARKAKDRSGIYLVPAFSGLGAPYWEPQARAALTGLTLDSGREEIIRAALEALAYQALDLVKAMQADYTSPLLSMRVDGGMANNAWLLQFLADLLHLKICRPSCTESTALGAAYLAGLQVGLYQSLEEIAALWKMTKAFEPQMESERRKALYQGWLAAINKVLNS